MNILIEKLSDYANVIKCQTYIIYYEDRMISE